MERGNLLVKMIELPTHFAQWLLQGSKLCRIVIMILISLFIITIFDIEFQIYRQKLDFLSFAY